MIYEGKKLYLEQQLLPKKSTADLLRYTDQQYAWAEANEPEIWRYFIEKSAVDFLGSNCCSKYSFFPS